jgi:LCP family protein required for cell wall assembly
VTQDENQDESAGERARDPESQPPANRSVSQPADLTELTQDGPRRTAPLFDNRPAVLKNPATLPPPGEHTDLAEASFAKVASDLGWVDKPVPTEEETEARRERRELHRKKVRRQRRKKKVLIIGGSVLALLVVLGVVWFQYTFGGLERMPAVAGQAGADTPGRTFLVIGNNPNEPAAGRAGGAGWKADFANSDLVMLVHTDSDNKAMYVISIPRDSAVQIPGQGTGKLSDAYAAGGAPLYVKTVEELTGVRLDRVLTLDLNAFREMADVFQGVVVDVPAVVCDEPAGPRRLDGQGALDYIALRTCMPDQDLDRVARQQSLMKALMRSAVDGGTVTHPFRVNRLLRAGAGNSTVEDGFSYPGMVGTLWSLRSLRTSNTTFLTVPVAKQPLFQDGGVDYVRLDKNNSADLWAALRADTLAEYLLLSGTAE